MRLFVVIFLLFSLTLGVMAQEEDQLTLTPIATYSTGLYDEGASEIAAYDSATQRLFVTNAASNTVTILDISDPTNPTEVGTISFDEYGGGVNSVAVLDGAVVFAAVEGEDTDTPGRVVIFDLDGTYVIDVEVGVLPDMVAVSPDGRWVLTANEGEPSSEYDSDPEGSISIIDLAADDPNMTLVTFEGVEIPEGVRIYGPNATPAQDLEPEYIAITPNSTTAYVTLQENNAVAVINIETASVISIVPLGLKDYSAEGNGIDASNEDGAINIQNYPVFGMYQPDAIAAYEVDGELYLVTANEGDARDYDTYSEEARLADFAPEDFDPEVFPNIEDLLAEDVLGRLNITTEGLDTNGDGLIDRILSYGARSFTIWNASGELVWDSGDQFERIIADINPDNFNSTNSENDSFDNRSDDKGPEPEGVVIGYVSDVPYAFIGLERQSGIMVYDISDPTAPVFVTYASNRNFDGDAEAGTAGDLGPEGLVFISAEDSPSGTPLLVVTNEISGTTTIYEIGE